VHWGPIWQAELYQGLLAEHDIEAFLPDVNTKLLDPFATGPLPMQTQVRVRERDAARAKKVLEAAAAGEGVPEDLEALALSAPLDPSLGMSAQEAAAWNEVDAIGSVREGARYAVERLASRTRWAALLWVTFPWALVCGFRYVGVARRRGLRSSKHRLTVAALYLAAIEPVLAILIWSLLRHA